MPEIIYEKNNDVVVLRVLGDVTFDQIIEAVKNYFPEVTKHLIWDYSDGSLRNVTADDFKSVPDISRKYFTNRNGGRTAFACPNALEYGMFRMYSAIVDITKMPYEYKVHHTFNDALKWVHDYWSG